MMLPRPISCRLFKEEARFNLLLQNDNHTQWIYEFVATNVRPVSVHTRIPGKIKRTPHPALKDAGVLAG
jgi:hypothetical protein